jgi:predicted CoA-binding protein
MRVAVLGASPDPDKYANKAIKSLLKHGHEVIPINPQYEEIEGLTVAKSIGDVKGPIETLTLYMNPTRLSAIVEDIIAAKPKRIIMNPGAESATLARRAKESGIECIEACTLVLLSIAKF